MATGIQVKSADTSVIENRLRQAEPGDVVTYEQLSTVLGRDIRVHCRGNLRTARKTLVGEGVFFDVVVGIGLKRLDMEEACVASESYVRRARSAATRGMRHLQNVEFDKLSEAGKQKHLTASAQLGAIHLFGSSKAAKRIAGKIDGESHLAVGDTLRLFTD